MREPSTRWAGLNHVVVRWVVVLALFGGETCLASPYAVSVVDAFHPDGLDVSTRNPQNALGSPDNVNFSLGATGWAELLMGMSIADAPGPDFAVFQEGSAVAHDESANVFLSFDANAWTLVGEIRRVGEVPGNGMFDIAGSGMSGASYVRVEHFGEPSSDFVGFDLDAVQVLPEPAAASLLLGTLAFATRASGRRRRRYTPRP